MSNEKAAVEVETCDDEEIRFLFELHKAREELRKAMQNAT